MDGKLGEIQMENWENHLEYYPVTPTHGQGSPGEKYDPTSIQQTTLSVPTL